MIYLIGSLENIKCQPSFNVWNHDNLANALNKVVRIGLSPNFTAQPNFCAYKEYLDDTNYNLYYLFTSLNATLNSPPGAIPNCSVR